MYCMYDLIYGIDLLIFDKICVDLKEGVLIKILDFCKKLDNICIKIE